MDHLPRSRFGCFLWLSFATNAYSWNLRPSCPNTKTKSSRNLDQHRQNQDFNTSTGIGTENIYVLGQSPRTYTSCDGLLANNVIFDHLHGTTRDHCRWTSKRQNHTCHFHWISTTYHRKRQPKQYLPPIWSQRPTLPLSNNPSCCFASCSSSASIRTICIPKPRPGIFQVSNPSTQAQDLHPAFLLRTVAISSPAHAYLTSFFSVFLFFFVHASWVVSFFFFFFLSSSGGWGKIKALAHHTSTYFHTRRVSISLSCFRSSTLAGAPFGSHRRYSVSCPYQWSSLQPRQRFFRVIPSWMHRSCDSYWGPSPLQAPMIRDFDVVFAPVYKNSWTSIGSLNYLGGAVVVHA